MDWSPGHLLASFVVGSVGFAALVYGKRQRRLPQVVTGIILLVFPYFVRSNVVMLVVAAALLGLMWFAIRMGY